MIRFLDILISLLVLIILSPLFIIISLLIKLTSKGAIFYKDKRVGKNNEIFEMYKFRSMTVNIQNENTWYTKKNDPRITKIGHFIRKTSIDELPQIINVLLGEMSLVGPRPESPFSESSYSKEYWGKVHVVKPGITGLAQVKGRSSLTLDKKIIFDLEYVSKIDSLPNFLKAIYYIRILLMTVGILINRKGTN